MKEYKEKPHLNFSTVEAGESYLAIRRHMLSRKVSFETRLNLNLECLQITDKLVDLSGVKNRRNGKTTRLVDSHIQTLFKEGKVLVYDHWYEGKDENTFLSDRHVLDVLCRRLSFEHSMRESRDYRIERDVDKNEIWVHLIR